MPLTITYITSSSVGAFRCGFLKAAFPQHEILEAGEPDSMELVDLKLKTTSSASTSAELLAKGGFSALMNRVTTISADYYIIDQSENGIFNKKNIGAVAKQATLATILMRSEKVRPQQIVLVTDKPQELTGYIQSPPEDSDVAKMKSGKIGGKVDTRIENVHVLGENMWTFHSDLDKKLGGALSNDIKLVPLSPAEKASAAGQRTTGGGKGGDDVLEAPFNDGYSR